MKIILITGFAVLLTAGSKQCSSDEGTVKENMGISEPVKNKSKPAEIPEKATDMAEKKDTESFPGYKTKETPDTVTDYRASISSRLKKLPAADLKNLPELIRELGKAKILAGENRGQWQAGKVQLGANPREYVPSDEELVESEIGNRIYKVVSTSKSADLSAVLEKAGITEAELGFGTISIRHVDVMGSGRFFYASRPEPVRITLQKP